MPERKNWQSFTAGMGFRKKIIMRTKRSKRG
jgi:hypothetical protein